MKDKILEIVPQRGKRRIKALTTHSCGKENKETTDPSKVYGKLGCNIINVVVLVIEYIKKTKEG